MELRTTNWFYKLELQVTTKGLRSQNKTIGKWVWKRAMLFLEYFLIPLLHKVSDQEAKLSKRI